MVSVPLSRRGMIAAAAALPIGIAGAPSPAATRGAADLDASLDHLARWTVRLNAERPAPEAEWDSWVRFSNLLMRRIEALPNVAANAPLRAKAILTLHEGDLAGLGPEGYPATRLTRQIVLALGCDR